MEISSSLLLYARFLVHATLQHTIPFLVFETYTLVGQMYNWPITAAHCGSLRLILLLPHERGKFELTNQYKYPYSL